MDHRDGITKKTNARFGLWRCKRASHTQCSRKDSGGKEVQDCGGARGSRSPTGSDGVGVHAGTRWTGGGGETGGVGHWPRRLREGGATRYGRDGERKAEEGGAQSWEARTATDGRWRAPSGPALQPARPLAIMAWGDLSPIPHRLSLLTCRTGWGRRTGRTCSPPRSRALLQTPATAPAHTPIAPARDDVGGRRCPYARRAHMHF